MQASETRLRQLIEGTRQYIVPLFQRPYSWSDKHWKTLWVDVLDQFMHADGRPHFFGSIVTAQAKSVPQGVGKFLLIDGQQRMTTTQVFLAAIRDAALAHGDTRLRDRIDGQYLVNGFEDGDERLKLLPTQDDRPAFRAIVQKTDIPEGRLATCYRFFAHQLGRFSAVDLDKIHTAVVDRLSLVSITCDDHDNPHLIFESLNAKGEKLTPADLIRNFLLMRVHVSDQERLFRSYWMPIQQAIGDNLTEFVRHYLMKEGKILKEAEVYLELKDRLGNSSPLEAEGFLKDLHRHGQFYAKFIVPNREASPDVSERLDRIRRLKVTVAYPFLLRIFDAADSGLLTHEQVLETLDVLESFVIRRSICSVPTNQLRRMLPPVFDNAKANGVGFIDGLRECLGGRHCPDDEVFVRHLTTEQLYSTTEKATRLRMILERLEQSFGHHEPADLARATIEHVLPQTITDEWEQELGAGAREHWNLLLHSLGNLTLTGYNGEMSNQPYAIKRVSLANSHYELNRYFANIERWTPDCIRERATSLAARALKIWPDVGRTQAPQLARKADSSRCEAVRFLGTTYPVTTWKDGFVVLLEKFDLNQPGLLKRIATERKMPTVISLNEVQFRKAKVRIGNVYVTTYAGATTLQDWCSRAAVYGSIGESEYAFGSADEVRFRGTAYVVATWKDGFLKLLELFESSQPGLLKRIAMEPRMQPVLSLSEEQFQMPRVRIGDVYVNTHASAATFQEWCKRVASHGNIQETEYEFTGK